MGRTFLMTSVLSLYWGRPCTLLLAKFFRVRSAGAPPLSQVGSCNRETLKNIRNVTGNHSAVISPWCEWDLISCCVPLIFYLSALALTTCPDLWLALRPAFFCYAAFLSSADSRLILNLKNLFSLGSDLSAPSVVLHSLSVRCDWQLLLSTWAPAPCSDCPLVISSGMCQSFLCQADCNMFKHNLHFFFFATIQLPL